MTPQPASTVRPARRHWPQALRLLWMLLLLLPAATSASAWHDWDLAPTQLLLASAWMLAALWLLLPATAFYGLSWPVVLAGVLCMGADGLRHVNLLELAAQWRTFSSLDVQAALRPYLPALAGASLVLGLLALACRRGLPKVSAEVWRWRALVVVSGTLALAALLPGVAWTRAWPASAAVLGAAMLADSPAWAGLAVPGIEGQAGRPASDWGAARAQSPPEPETLVLVIGESVRSDYLPDCGGPPGVRPVTPGALVACDVTAGSNATHTAVPLLISRDWPGLRRRIPADGSFQSALARVGFETAWLATQSRDVAWPDARIQHFSTLPDRQALLPALDEQLRAHPGRLSLVLHMTGAHEPYCARFERRHAPFGDLCGQIGDAPSADDPLPWRAMYANAVDDSIGFLDEVIQRLSRVPGRVFLVFTPDHGENLMDDERRLHGHALRTPTRWDTRVPAVFWSNEAWRAANPGRWEQLRRNAALPLMHADIVPTLLQSADLRFDDARTQAFGLLNGEVGPRERVVQRAIGSTVPFDELVKAAGDARPAPPVALRPEQMLSVR
jgi:Sulfatase